MTAPPMEPASKTSQPSNLQENGIPNCILRNARQWACSSTGVYKGNAKCSPVCVAAEIEVKLCIWIYSGLATTC